MQEIPSNGTTEPDHLIAGDTWTWNKALAEFQPSDGWTLHYAFKGPGVISDLASSASADGMSFEVRQDAAVSAAYVPGTYEMAGYVTKGADRHQVSRSVVVVQENIDAVTVASPSHAEKTLTALEAAVEGRLASALDDVTINGRRVSKMDPAELRKWLAHYRSLVWRERNPGRLGPTIGVSFGRRGG